MRILTLFLASVPIWLSHGVNAQVIGPVGRMVLSNGPVSPDGWVNQTTRQPRQAVLVNGVTPGPLLRGNKGDRFQITVQNNIQDEVLLNSTSVHWHGIFQHDSPFSDGPAFVTQCPIAPQQSFPYDFVIPDQAGTYWYHSHLSTQYCDGLRGPMVVYDPKDPYANLYDVDNEQTIITLADWYHTPVRNIQGIATPDATLINGLGRYPFGPISPLSVINVKYNTRYRFRLINMACDPNYLFYIDNHLMTVIEADGVNHQPVTVDSLQIFAGQRYSVIVKTKTRAETPYQDNYWIRALPNISSLAGFANGTNMAILRYEGAQPVEPPADLPPTLHSTLNEKSLHPLVDPAAPGEPRPGGANVTIPLNVTLNQTTRLFEINGHSWQSPPTPVLLQIMNGVDPRSLLPLGSIYTLNRGDIVELQLNDANVVQYGAPHPFHLHGHVFSVTRAVDGTENYVNPVRRDTVSLGYGEGVHIRFVADNPGPWFLHCHIDFHLEAGMAVVMAEDIPGIRNLTQPEPWKQLCNTYNSLSNIHK